MAKTIKFNLTCNGNSIRTIEDLQNNFCVEDVLNYYNTGLLKRWLNVRGFDIELKKIDEITEKDDVKILTQLASIFNVETEEKKIIEELEIINYKKSVASKLESAAITREKFIKTIDDYKKGYYELKKEILANPTNMPLIKKAIQMIIKEYEWIFSLNFRTLFYQIKDVSPLAVLCFLMYKETRRFFIVEENTPEACKSDVENIYKEIKELITNFSEEDFYTKVGKDNIKTVSRNNEYPDNVEQKGKQYLTVRTFGASNNTNFAISSFNNENQDKVERNEFVNKFLIFNGLSYCSRNEKLKLVYLAI